MLNLNRQKRSGTGRKILLKRGDTLNGSGKSMVVRQSILNVAGPKHALF